MKNLINYIKTPTETPQSEPIPGTSQVPNSAGRLRLGGRRLDAARPLPGAGQRGRHLLHQRARADPGERRGGRSAASRPTARARWRVSSRSRRRAARRRTTRRSSRWRWLPSWATTTTRRAALARAAAGVPHRHAPVPLRGSSWSGLRGWGRGLREAVGPLVHHAAGRASLAYQAIKYQQRDGWSHRDLLRLAHPQAADATEHEAIYNWMVDGWDWVGEEPHPDPALATIWAFERAKRANDGGEVIGLIREYDLPREAVPTEWLNERGGVGGAAGSACR